MHLSLNIYGTPCSGAQHTRIMLLFMNQAIGRQDLFPIITVRDRNKHRKHAWSYHAAGYYPISTLVKESLEVSREDDVAMTSEKYVY